MTVHTVLNLPESQSGYAERALWLVQGMSQNDSKESILEEQKPESTEAFNCLVDERCLAGGGIWNLRPTSEPWVLAG